MDVSLSTPLYPPSIVMKHSIFINSTIEKAEFKYANSKEM